MDNNPRKTGDIIVAIFLILVGIGFTIGAIRMNIGTLTKPHAGFQPFLGGTTLIILSVLFLAQAWRRKTEGTQSFGTLWRPVALTLGLIVYVTTLDVVGYIINTMILSAITLRVLETKSLWVLTVTSALLSIGSYLLFDRLLGITLPGGILATFL